MTMPDTWVGQDVITTRSTLLNGGTDYCPAKVTFVDSPPEEGPHGGVMVNLFVMPNGTGALSVLGVTSVELFEYEETARLYATGTAAWLNPNG